MSVKYKILPVLIKIILWGSAEDDNKKKVPIAVRVFLALVLGVVYLGLSALLFWVGFADKNAMLVLLGGVCLVCLPVAVLLELKLKKEQ